MCLQRYWQMGEISALWVICHGTVLTEVDPKYKSRQSSNSELRAFSVTLVLIISPGRYLSLMDWKPKKSLLLDVCRSAFFICLSSCSHVYAYFFFFFKKPPWSSLNCSRKQAAGRCAPLLTEGRWWWPVRGIHKQTCRFLAVASCQYSWNFTGSATNISPSQDIQVKRWTDRQTEQNLLGASHQKWSSLYSL